MKNLTVIFITKNRNQYLVRNLRRWVHTGAQIVIMDGSTESYKTAILAAFPTVKYFHDTRSVESRLYSASKLITTQYSMVAADDDLMIFKGVTSCISELESNSELVAVIGDELRFAIENSEIKFHKGYPNLLKYGSVTNSNHWVRSYSHYKNYETSSFYSVIRTDIFRRVCSVFENIPTLDSNLLELLIEFSVTFLGKVKVIEELSWLRSSETTANWSSEYPYGYWVLSLNKNPVRTELIRRMDSNILSSKSHFPGILRKALFLMILLSIDLSDLCRKLKISLKFRWILLPFLFCFVNLNAIRRKDISKKFDVILKYQFSNRKNLNSKAEYYNHTTQKINNQLISNNSQLLEIKNLVEKFHNRKE